MLKKELIKRSPIRILEKSIHGGLGKGNLGVFAARKGVGKTASLVHVSIDKLLRDQKVLHISFAENPHHIENWYDQVFMEVTRAYKLENTLDDHDQIIQNRMILHFKQNDISLDRIRENISQICQGARFHPEVIIVDGFSFYHATEDDFNFWKQLAKEQNAAIWFSATLHRENIECDENGIPAPVNRYSAFFSVIITLDPMHDHIVLNLLKDHDSKDLKALELKLDPNTLLIADYHK